MRFATIASFVVALTIATIAAAQGDRARVDAAVQRALASLAQCSAANPRTPCNVFACDAIRAAYGPDLAAEFLAGGRCPSADQLLEILMSLSGGTRKPKNPANQWTLIGSALDAVVLQRAQACANDGFLTIAASSSRSTGDQNGHIALIVPGTLASSSKWKTDVPQVAAERLDAAGTTGERANSTRTAMSEHWSNATRGSIKIFVFGIHKAAQISNRCN
jgi:hypothetical protein